MMMFFLCGCWEEASLRLAVGQARVDLGGSEGHGDSGRGV